VIGDESNVASRLQALTKEPGYQARILVSETTLQSAKGRYATRALGNATVRGRTGTVKLFALDGASPAAPQEKAATTS
jgi:adenylate cyclase